MSAQSASTASSRTTRTGRPRTTSSRAGTRARSSSTARTSAPTPARATVSEPRPAPISSTRTPGAAPASRARARARLGSARKCWPRERSGRIPCFEARSRRARRVRPPFPGASALPGDADADGSGAERSDLGERLVREVDDPASDPRPTVPDYHSDRAAVRRVEHDHLGAAGKGPVRRVKPGEPPAARRGAPVPVVPGGDPPLLVGGTRADHQDLVDRIPERLSVEEVPGHLQPVLEANLVGERLEPGNPGAVHPPLPLEELVRVHDLGGVGDLRLLGDSANLDADHADPHPRIELGVGA